MAHEKILKMCMCVIPGGVILEFVTGVPLFSSISRAAVSKSDFVQHAKAMVSPEIEIINPL